MSRPPIDPDKSLAGIVLDPHTLERIVPESKRPDGSVRKQIRIREGFTPQEDIRRFRSTIQQQMDARVLPKGQIVGWVPPPVETNEAAKPLSKSAKKNAKRKEKRAEKKQQTSEAVPDDWEDDEEAQDGGKAREEEAKPASPSTSKAVSGADGLVDKLGKLKV